jgi:hypothetical protein
MFYLFQQIYMLYNISYQCCFGVQVLMIMWDAIMFHLNKWYSLGVQPSQVPAGAPPARCRSGVPRSYQVQAILEVTVQSSDFLAVLSLEKNG